MKKLIMITTVPMSLATLVKGQPKYLSNFFDVKLITSYSSINNEIVEYEGVELKSINMTRKITIYQDLKAMVMIFLYILKEKPDVVYTFTPKAGLLGMMASFFARVPTRIHNIVGMPLMEARGKKRYLLQFIEKLTYFFATKLFCNSFGLKQYIAENLTKKDITVIANGSINGVDTEHFKDSLDANKKHILRESYSISSEDFVITFVGRIVKDKGINELIEAFSELQREYKNIKLLLVGDYEENLNPIKPVNKKQIDSSKDIISVGFQDDIRDFLAISDLFVLPSYREGLPNSLIEAGSYGIPLVATNINGCNEIILDNETGILVNSKDVKSLKEGIKSLLKDKELYNKIKSQVRESTIDRYSQNYFWDKLRDELEKTI